MPKDPREGEFFYDRFIGSLFNIVDKPVTWFREKIVVPANEKNKHYYYHRRFRRVPTIDECYTDDEMCIFEANEQFKRDKAVDNEILRILRQRKIECEIYHGPDAPKRCEKVTEDYFESAGNWFEKYGDLGVSGEIFFVIVISRCFDLSNGQPKPVQIL